MCLPQTFNYQARADTQVCPYTDLQTDLIWLISTA